MAASSNQYVASAVPEKPEPVSVTVTARLLLIAGPLGLGAPTEICGAVPSTLWLLCAVMAV